MLLRQNSQIITFCYEKVIILIGQQQYLQVASVEILCNVAYSTQRLVVTSMKYFLCTPFTAGFSFSTNRLKLRFLFQSTFVKECRVQSADLLQCLALFSEVMHKNRTSSREQTGLRFSK